MHLRLWLLAAVVVVGAGCGTTNGGDSLPRGPATSGDSTPTTTAKHHRRQHRHAHPQPKPRRHEPRPAHRRVPAVDVPNPTLTPGAILTTSAARVCRSGYAASVRDVSESEKEAVYARYGVPHVPYQHEVDHLVSLELGGSNANTNLWPEPYAGRWGARTKDVLENRLHDLVCSGAIELGYAQRIEAHNWVAAYRQYVGTPPASSGSNSSGSGGSSGGGTGATGPGCEPGYSPCLPVTGDLDCSQISDSKKPIRVTGSDPYRLDADGDGLGCE